jgi:tetratricopeptide (TPR) repeat protein
LKVDASTSRKLLADIDKAHRDLGSGRRVDAVLVYEEISRRKDLDAVMHAALGRLSLALDGTFQAVEHFQAAVEEKPDEAKYLGFLGIALHAERRSEEAAEIFERAMAIDDNIPGVLNGLGVIHTNRGDYEKATELLRKAERAKPSDGAVQTNLAMALAHVNEYDEALKHASKGLKLAPDSINSHYTYGTVLAESGRVDDAVKHFEKTIRQHRMFGGAYDHLARLKKFSKDDAAFMAKAEKVLEKGMPANDRLCLHFALGKMYDDCQQYDHAFEHYRQGNLLKRKNYDIRIATRLFDQIRKSLSAKALQKLQQLGSESDMPIFIVGMPRSGTTLMERMITSSDGVAGAGELVEMPHIAEDVATRDKPRQFSALLRQNLTQDGIKKYAEQYMRVLRQADPTASRIVDKLPTNYLHVWLISILFPRASIIFARRHPLDVALSCYFQNFATIPWADDFTSIAEAYRFHRTAMDHWKRLLPDGKIIDVQYERLVEEPDTYGRQMLESCGLTWSGDGLEHYKKEKVVKTASLWQVRQPVYQSSRMRWKNYAPFLGDLANELSDFLQDDREELARHGIDIPAPSSLGRLKKLFG